MESQEAGMLLFAAQTAIAAATDLREARHAFDIEMQEIAGYGMLVALHGRWRVQVAPAAQPDAAQNTADGGRAKPAAVSDQIAGQTLEAQLHDVVGETVGQTARAAMRP